MKNKDLYCILVYFLAFIAIGCSDQPNDWEYDPNYDILFRPIKFEIKESKATSVLIEYKGVEEATKYVFEFSEGDSLLFTNVIRTVEILADTLTPYTKEATVSATTYRTLFKELNGTSKYSVRLRAVNQNNGKESKYVQAYFKTPSEQVFTNNILGLDNIMLYWEPNIAVTHISYGELKYQNEKNDTIWAPKRIITDIEKKEGSISVDGLKPGTNYVFVIYNELVRRGSLNLRTLGSNTGGMIKVNAGDDIDNLLKSSADSTVSLIFDKEQTYEIGKITIPKNINRLYLIGGGRGGSQPLLKLYSISLSGSIRGILCQNIEIDNTMKENFQINVNGGKTFRDVEFDGCIIRNIPRSLIRIDDADAKIGNIKINNCIIKNVGANGYGLINVGKASSISTISITNTTMIDIGDQLMDIRVDVDKISINNMTFCNYTIGIPKIFLLNKQPKAITVKNSIFTGDNKGDKVNSGNGDYSSYLNFSSCYLTSDFEVNKNKFTNAVIVGLTSEELFVNPRQDDFHFKSDVKFAGKGEVGDPRWW